MIYNNTNNLDSKESNIYNNKENKEAIKISNNINNYFDKQILETK